MEKRLLASFVLSFIVLFAWNALNPPAETPKPAISEQNSVSKNVGTDTAEEFPAPEIAESLPPEILANEKIYTIENDLLRVEASNIGGVIKRIYLKEYDAELPVTDIVLNPDFRQSVFSAQVSSQAIKFQLTEQEISVTKTFELSRLDYVIDVNVQTGQPKKALRIQSHRVDVSKLDKNELGREKGLQEYSIYNGQKVIRKTGAVKFNDKDEKRELGEVRWMGFRNKYFAFIHKPLNEIEGYRTSLKGDQRLDFILDISQDDEDFQNGHFSSQIYAGPQLLPLLKSYEGAEYDKILVFFKVGFMDGVAKLMLKMLGVIHKVIPNWGLTIIILAIALNLLSYPLIMNQMKTARKMQALQPKITQLKDKYHNNPQKMQKEQMELFRKHKVNPLGGCLPLMLQMPIFIALYQVLWRSVFFNGAGFLWIRDLSQPDQLMTLPFYLPLMGNEVNLLPIIMGVLMFFQQTLSSKNMTVTDPMQVSQQKMMKILFPIMMLVFFYKAASGLTLYFVVLYVFMAGTQLKLSKMPKVEVL